MTKTTVIAAILVLLLLGTALASLIPEEAKKIVAGNSGLKVYPRWNKSFRPIAEAKKGDTLLVLREMGSWKQVKLEKQGVTGWAYCEVKKKPPSGPGASLTLPEGAAPTTSGLVSKGWSDDYARSQGASPGKIREVMNRTLDHGQYVLFLENKGDTK